MMRLTFIGFLLLFNHIHAQKIEKGNPIVLMGKILEFNSLEPVSFCKINFNSETKYQVSSNIDGSFKITVWSKDVRKRNKLTILLIGNHPFYLKNVPLGKDSVFDFGTIIFPTYTTYEDNVVVIKKGKHRCTRRGTKQERQRISDSALKVNMARLESYRYYYRGQTFRLDIRHHCVNFENVE